MCLAVDIWARAAPEPAHCMHLMPLTRMEAVCTPTQRNTDAETLAKASRTSAFDLHAWYADPWHSIASAAAGPRLHWVRLWCTQAACVRGCVSPGCLKDADAVPNDSQLLARESTRAHLCAEMATVLRHALLTSHVCCAVACGRSSASTANAREAVRSPQPREGDIALKKAREEPSSLPVSLFLSLLLLSAECRMGTAGPPHRVGARGRSRRFRTRIRFT